MIKKFNKKTKTNCRQIDQKTQIYNEEQKRKEEKRIKKKQIR